MSEKIIRGVFKEKEKSMVQSILDIASNSNLEEIIIFGITKNNNLYFSSSISDASVLVYMCERIKADLLKESEIEDEPERE